MYCHALMEGQVWWPVSMVSQTLHACKTSGNDQTNKLHLFRLIDIDPSDNQAISHYSFIQLLIHPIIHSSNYSFIQLLVHPITHSSNYSFIHTCKRGLDCKEPQIKLGLGFINLMSPQKIKLLHMNQTKVCKHGNATNQNEARVVPWEGR